MSVLNPFAQEMDTILTLSNSRIDSVRIFNISDTERPLELNAPQPQGSLSQAHVFSLNVESKATNSYLIRLETDAIMATRIALKSLDQFNLVERISNLHGPGRSLGWYLWFYCIFCSPLPAVIKVFAQLGVLGSTSVMFFVPASVGISFDLPINVYLPNGCIETYSVGGILIAQLLALLKLKWRQVWVRALIKLNIAAQVGILLSDVVTPSYLTEAMLYTTTTFAQLLTIFVTTVYRSKYPSVMYICQGGHRDHSGDGDHTHAQNELNQYASDRAGVGVSVTSGSGCGPVLFTTGHQRQTQPSRNQRSAGDSA